MQIKAGSPEEYIAKIPAERQEFFQQLRQAILTNLPEGFKEQMNYGMIGYVVPHSVYPVGYHVKPSEPLPFINIASQKNFIAFYHMGLYANKPLLDWFIKEYPKHCSTKLDMGKSCIRFKKIADIPYQLIAELVQKMSCVEWIKCYESQLKR